MLVPVCWVLGTFWLHLGQRARATFAGYIDNLARFACNARSRVPYVFALARPTPGAGGKDYRANFVHAPFPKRPPCGSVVRRLPAHETSPAMSPRGFMMNASSNPQAAAVLRRKNYRDVTNPDKMGLTGTVNAIMALASFALLAGIVLGMI